MPTIAYEEADRLVIDFGHSNFSVPAIPGHLGKKASTLLVSVAMGVSDPAQTDDMVTELTEIVLGKQLARWKARKRAFENLRAPLQSVVVQAATLWNVHGGGIDAVNDLLDEAGGGYPKALGRVMHSLGLGEQYELLRTYLDGAAQAQNSPAGSSASTTTPTGTANTFN